MPITKDQKSEILRGLVQQMKDAKSVVFANFSGVSVKDAQILRRKLRDSGVNFKVAKKTLIKLAAKEAGFGDLSDDILEGSVAAAFSMEDEIIAAKLLHNFKKKNANLELRGALFDGRVLSVEETRELALIPGRDELVAKFIYILKSPISGFHSVLNNTISGFVRVLDAISKQ
ncbi:MAG: 50S ribosomal protein L10 [Candidatus Peregrinibacteria bacterium]